MDNVLTVRNLNKNYDSFSLDNISFDLPAGTITGLVGENGAGKTTLIKSLLNLTNYEADEITFFNKDLRKEDKDIKEKIGVVFDEFSFNELLTPKQIEKIAKAGYTNWNSLFFDNFLKKYNIPKDKKVSKFSRGMKIKLQFAIALSHAPQLLILDEVTSGLDAVIKEDLVDILFDFIQDERNAVLISSHDINELEKFTDYIFFINQGTKIFDKPKDELLDEFILLRSPLDQFETLKKEDIVAYRKRDYHYDVIIKKKDYKDLEELGSVVDRISLNDFITIYLKGVRNEKFAF